MNLSYLDNNATTPLDPRVIDILKQELISLPANPSSVHAFGRRARQTLTKARETIASFLKVRPSELVFTSCATESLNTVLRSIFACKQGHLVTSSLEHSSILKTAQYLEKQGVDVTYLSPGAWGATNVEAVHAAFRPSTRLIALSAVNSETGVKTDIAKIASLAKEKNIPFLVDGVALLGKELFTLPEGVSAIAFSGHKLHAPKGIGLTWLHPSFCIEPLLTGGDQENGRRAGTENMLGILGLAKAIDLLNEELPAATLYMETLRNSFEESVKKKVGRVLINGEGPRICNTSNLSFEGVDGETLLMQLDLAGIAASHGSACASGALELSHVLRNMGLPLERVRSSLRFSFSRMTKQEEVTHAVEILSKIIPRLRHYN